RISSLRAHDTPLLRASCSGGRSSGTAVFADGARSSGACRRLALGSVRRPEVLFAAPRWLCPHDLSTPEEALDRSAAGAMGLAVVPKRRRSAAPQGSGVSGGVRRLPGVGNAHRGGNLPGRLAPAGRNAGPALVVGVRRHAVRAPAVAT